MCDEICGVVGGLDFFWVFVLGSKVMYLCMSYKNLVGKSCVGSCRKFIKWVGWLYDK